MRGPRGAASFAFAKVLGTRHPRHCRVDWSRREPHSRPPPASGAPTVGKRSESQRQLQ